MKITFVLLAMCFFAVSVPASESHRPLQQMEQLAFGPNTETDALLLYAEKEILFERYANGYTSDNKHVAWSASKSISSAIIGALVYQKQIDIEKSICDYVPQARDFSHCDLRTSDFLSWSSGLIWNELYEDPSGDREQSSVGQLLYGDGIVNKTQFVISHPSLTVGKKDWNYSTGDSTFVMALARGAVPVVEEQIFPWKYFFDPLGIDVTFGQDLAGNFGGGSSMYIRPRDLAKIGELYLARGLWNGKRIFSEEWVEFTNQRPEAFDIVAYGNETFHSKRSWWTLNPKIAQARRIPDTLIANGHWGQFLVIVPSLKMVLVRMGNNQNSASNFDLVGVIEKAVRAVEEQQGAKP